MIFTDEQGRRHVATDEELDAYDREHNTERVPSRVLDSYIGLTGALALMEKNNTLVEKTAKKYGAWNTLRTAQGMLTKGLDQLTSRMSIRQSISVRENCRNVNVIVGVQRSPLLWNIQLEHVDVLVKHAMRACQECLLTEGESRKCKLREALDCIPGVDGDVDAMGMCPYLGRGGEET